MSRNYIMRSYNQYTNNQEIKLELERIWKNEPLTYAIHVVRWFLWATRARDKVGLFYTLRGKKL